MKQRSAPKASLPKARFSFQWVRPMTPFERSVKATVLAIPKGATLSYAGVALRSGKPGAARAVVRALHGLEGIPWWRVIRSDGTLAAQVAREQERLLAREGVRFTTAGRPRR